ncbi:response regulator [Acidilutibacter cellobiosedens]|jgi:two-component system LytT family response regulator|uniref:Response regulator n=1 Tax=Acidilutibacter cellobiosedens TaxID=2507161 RepID=A0A410QGP9_9FIRM|nr:LytTR family transcriptional regulator DNA-binding domain-containing protein [Acidilutibacter cellobiosedens]QAT63116.1 response regulator [Acidilutibacter cellobiosedens]
MNKLLLVKDNSIFVKSLAEAEKSIRSDLNITVANCVEEFLRYIKTDRYDLFMLDVGLKNCSPIGLAKKIRNMDVYRLTPIFFVFFVSMAKSDMLKEMHCWNYVTDFFIEKNRRKNPSELCDNSGPYIILKKKDFSYVVRTNEIIYIESAKKSINVFTVNKEISLSSYTFTLEKLLDDLNKLTKDFVRCHRGYIVNIRYIEKFNNDSIKLISIEEPISIGEKYKEDFENKITSANCIVETWN